MLSEITQCCLTPGRVGTPIFTWLK